MYKNLKYQNNKIHFSFKELKLFKTLKYNLFFPLKTNREQ